MNIIIDYGLGNLKSIQNQLRRLGHQSIISSKVKDVITADRLILPGVGHFAHGIKNLYDYRLVNILNQKVLENKTPILGICLGMQLFTQWSEEGNAKGLMWIKAKTNKFKAHNYDKLFKIPHIGWNSIQSMKTGKLLFNIDEDSLFYFAHSYYVDCEEEKDILATR